MPQLLSAKTYGLPARTVLEHIDTATIAIVINRKSRIIMADGKKIVEKAKILREFHPDTTITLKTNAPVCSKTRAYLAGQDIPVTALK